MDFLHIRHATSLITYQGLKILIDPVLAPKGHVPPIAMTPCPNRNPTVELPFGDEALAKHLSTLDLILVTHRHQDHYDNVAKETLPKHIPVLCQPQDEAAFISDGFATVLPVSDTLNFKGIQVSKTEGQHGLGRKDLGPVSGFVLKADSEPLVYFAGDTVWCPEVENALLEHRPHVVVVNAGGAGFLTGTPITMTHEDIGHIMKIDPHTRVIAVHMEAINHCVQSRQELEQRAREHEYLHRLLIPKDGQELSNIH